MRAKLLLALVTATFLTGCEFYMAPSDFWGKFFRSQNDSAYYENKAHQLVAKLGSKVDEYEINKIAVIDLVNEEGRVPVLGEYMTARLVEEIARRQGGFRVAQRGEVREILSQLDLKPSLHFNRQELRQLGGHLKTQAILNGKIVDLGTNLDVQVVLVDVVTGEVIASATEQLNRTRFAVEMLRHF